MLLPLLLNLGFAGGGATSAPAPSPAPTPGNQGRGKGRGPKRKELVRYAVEYAGEVHYFWTEADARDFLERQAQKVKRQAKAVARKTHRITAPAGATPLPIPQVRPLERFMASGSPELEAMSLRINSQISAILINPDFDADMDDDDLTRLLQ